MTLSFDFDPMPYDGAIVSRDRYAELQVISSALLEKKFNLKMMTVIPNMGEYAEAWRDLADEFDNAGFQANAENCRAEARYYDSLADGEYLREQETINFVTVERRELTPVEKG